MGLSAPGRPGRVLVGVIVEHPFVRKRGVTLDVDVPARHERDVLDLIDKLADLGWASPDAR